MVRLIQHRIGSLFKHLTPLPLLVDYLDSLVSPVARFPEFCFLSERISLATPRLDGDPSSSGSVLFIGFANSGKLYVTGNSTSVHVLASNATSFTIVSGFVIFTTSAHEAIFAPICALPSLVAEGGPKTTPTDWEKRRVERGSRIVVAVASSMSLILQMPRGNLETINPRPLVMEVVRQDLDA